MSVDSQDEWCDKNTESYKHSYAVIASQLRCCLCGHIYQPSEDKKLTSLPGLLGQEAVKDTPTPDPSRIVNHEGKKYLRTIYSAVDPKASIQVDVYAIIEGYKITCPAVQHCLKKVLAAGQRGKGSVVKDLQGAIDALHRAIELQKQREIIAPQ